MLKVIKKYRSSIMLVVAIVFITTGIINKEHLGVLRKAVTI